MSERRFYGKYRGTVVKNTDPMMIGRLQVIVPAVSNVQLSSWAMPCLPAAGIQNGIIAVPIPGSGVWIEFEQGDPDYPIWVGCFWGSTAEVPPFVLSAPAPTPAIAMQTPKKNGMVISDGLGPLGLGGIVLQSTTGATIAINDNGILLMNGKGAQITLAGKTVDINLGALTIT